MAHDIHSIPAEIPVPTDDGRCDHLIGRKLPDLALPTTTGANVRLDGLEGTAVVFAYPRTGRPGHLPLVSNWNQIPGARGCTPQTSGFRDHYEAFRTRGVSVFGLSTQTTSYQHEMAERLELPFPVLSDHELRLTDALNLPTFTVTDLTLLKRFAWVAVDGVIVKVFYPVFPPGENAEEVLAWLSKNAPTV